MPLPGGIQTCTMTGTLLDDAGNPLIGYITLTPSLTELVSASTNVLITLVIKTIQLDSNGSFSVPLICSNEASVAPNGVTWTLTTSGSAPMSIGFTVPADVGTTADVADYVISVSMPTTPSYLIGFRGPQGLPGVADDTSMSAIVANTASATRTTLSGAYVSTSQLVISPTAPSTPAAGTVWIQNV